MRFQGYIFLIINVIVVAPAMTGKEQAEHPNYPLLPQVPDCSKIDHLGRIVGGFETKIGQYPWMAQLGFGVLYCPPYTSAIYFDCGSSLITTSVLLTAAHCIRGGNTVYCPTTKRKTDIIVGFVKLGQWNQNNKGKDCVGTLCADETQIIPVKSLKLHEDYDADTYMHDIGMIYLETPAILTDWVNPVCMPIGGMLRAKLVGKNAEVIGWGRTSNNGDPSDVQGILKSVDIPVRKQSDCNLYFKGHGFRESPNSIICAGGNEGENSCNGDSGAPLMIAWNVKRVKIKFLVGLVSFGPNLCGSKEVPSVYSRISYYMKWILDNLV